VTRYATEAEYQEFLATLFKGEQREPDLLTVDMWSLDATTLSQLESALANRGLAAQAAVVTRHLELRKSKRRPFLRFGG
jgi:hypothetical protein